MGAVLTFALYVWVLAVPLALLCGMLDLVPWALALRFVLVEIVLGLAAAAWGLYCSFHSDTVRRALALSLGGVAAMLLAHTLVFPLWELLRTLKVVTGNSVAYRHQRRFFPIPMLFGDAATQSAAVAPNGVTLSSAPYDPAIWPLESVVYLALAAVLLVLTARNFHKLAREA